MNYIGVASVAAACILAILCLFLWRWLFDDWMPAELKGAKLAMVERKLAVKSPYPVVGRPDQVYRTPAGTHVPLERKNRSTFSVFQTDVAQLSLQSWLLHHTGLPVTDYGFVVINNREVNVRRCIRVQLLPHVECERLIRRYLDIVEERVLAKKMRGKKCESCGHQKRCFK